MHQYISVFFQSTDKVALRNLSMVMRQLSADAEERIRLVDDSVVKAKEAVQCDIQDGVSWCMYYCII